MTNPMAPSAALLCKLGSVVVHADELLSPDGHEFDREALAACITDPEVAEWLQQMGELALIPLKRKTP